MFKKFWKKKKNRKVQKRSVHKAYIEIDTEMSPEVLAEKIKLLSYITEEKFLHYTHKSV